MKIKPIRFIKTVLGIRPVQPPYPQDFEILHKEIIEKVQPYTMTSVERLFTLIESVKEKYEFVIDTPYSNVSP